MRLAMFFLGSMLLACLALPVLAADEPATTTAAPAAESVLPAAAGNAAVAPPSDSTLAPAAPIEPNPTEPAVHAPSENAPKDYSSLLFVFMLATFIGLGVIMRVSRLLHTPLMSLTNAISAIAVVGSILVTGSEGNPPGIRFLGAIALFASMTNIVSGFLITDRMLKMFKSPGQGGKS
jgi:NAD(P) transhydrogenase subunit alpha